MIMNRDTASPCQVPASPGGLPEPAGEPRLGKVLRSLGVFGCASVEDAILAGLAIGEPLLFIGNPGCAKTLVSQRLADGLRMRFWAYDAGKALFEDVVGFPDPVSLGEGEVRYVPTRLSLWGKEFVLLDEISRANYAMQNKWLEVVRSRRLMGMSLPDLKLIVAAMNPPGLAGTSALDEALAGRFTFHVTFPDAHQMDAADLRRVIEVPDDGSDSTMLPDLRPLLVASRAAFPDTESRDGGAATAYVERLAEYFAGKDHPLDGRRLGMMRRALLALAAVHRVVGAPPGNLDSLLTLFRHGLDCLLPFAAAGVEVSRLIVEGAHEFASASVRGHVRVLPPHDVLGAARMLARQDDVVPDADLSSLLVTRIFQEMEHPHTVERAGRSGAALLTVALSKVALWRLVPDTRHRVLAGYRDLLDLDASDVGCFQTESESLVRDAVIDGSVRDAALRLAYVLTSRLGRTMRGGAEFEDMAKCLIETYSQGGAA